MMYSRYNENAPFFPSLKWGEGGLNFSSILSKIVADKLSINPTLNEVSYGIVFLESADVEYK